MKGAISLSDHCTAPYIDHWFKALYKTPPFQDNFLTWCRTEFSKGHSAILAGQLLLGDGIHRNISEFCAHMLTAAILLLGNYSFDQEHCCA